MVWWEDLDTDTSDNLSDSDSDPSVTSTNDTSFTSKFNLLIEHKAITIEIHPKVGQTCLNILFPALFLFDIHSFIFL